MNLADLFLEIKDERLSRGALESYEQRLAHLYGEYMLRIATLKKAEALFFYAKEQQNPELPDIKIKRIWKASDEGIDLTQKEIEVKAISKILSSIRSRIYQTPNY